MIVANGQTDVTTYFVLRDSTTHLPKTSVTVTDIDVYYVEQGAAISAKADLTALGAADSAHADNKGIEIGQGLYRIDWPDAAFDGGVGKTVTLIVVCTGVDTTYLEVELSPPVNSVALGGTAQTGRDIGASVLLSSGTGTGQISLSSGAVTAGTVGDKTGYALTIAYDAAKTAATQTSVDTIDGIVDAILLDTAEIGAAGAGLSAIPWSAAWDAEVQSECADALAAYDPPTKAELDSGLAGLTIPSAASVADAVWDESLSGHTASGSTGEAIAAAGSAGDPWSTALPGAYGSGTAGKIISDALDAAVSTRLAAASYLAPDNADIAAIKAKTDNLPASPAATGDAMTLASQAITAAAVAADAIAELQAGLATSAEIAALTDVTAGDVVAAIEAAVPAVNIKQINDVALSGTGVIGDEWGPA